MKIKVYSIVVLFIFLQCASFSQDIQVNYVSSFENINHPSVAYWFFAANMMPEDRYKGKIDSFARFSKYSLIFLTARDGVDFYDFKTMHPVFQKVVAYAHQKGLKIGLQIWKNDANTKIENTDRLMQEGEVALDENGKAEYKTEAKHVRDMETLIKSELYKIYAFKKTADGFYDPSSLKEISTSATAINSKSNVTVQINGGSNFKGYTAYVLTQHYYNSCNNYAAQAKEIITNAFKAYSDIPFDGIGLDEYKGMKIARQKILEEKKEVFRERVYALAMADTIKSQFGLNMDSVLLHMRFAPAGKPTVRIKAINAYMSVLRAATLSIETAIYDLGKKMYGEDAFIGLHNTFHNNLDRDEVWQTGVTSWLIKRDYGHTDELTPTAMQLGVGINYPKNVLYNMYYNKSLEQIWTKALVDLRYGIRTHYHAANDVQGWGVSIDQPEALVKINKVENAARLLNRFNPSFPHNKLLVVYGMEAMYNWYPDTAQRGLYDLNDKLKMEVKTNLLWENGYQHAAIPTDLINNGRLKINKQGKPVLNGYVFDAILLLNPQFAKTATTKYFQEYIQKGGKLLLEGNATYDYNGNSIASIWHTIAAKAVDTSFSLPNMLKLGDFKQSLVDGVINEDGSYTFTNVASLKNDSPATFAFTCKGVNYSGTYKGMAAIKLHVDGTLDKLAATGFTSFQKNGKVIVALNKEADIFLSFNGNKVLCTIAGDAKQVQLTYSK